MLWFYSIRPLLCWSKFLLCLLSEEFFIINGCWILSKAFYASIEMIIWFLSFSLLIWYITLITLCIMTHLCIPGINPTWSWCMIFLMCCWILLARILNFLHLYSSVILACNFPFWWYLCLLLVLGWWWPHKMSLRAFLSLLFFWKSLSEIGVSSSLNFW